MDTQTPDNPIINFLRSKAAIPVGFVLALALGVFFMYQGLDRTCCVGALIIAILMFFIVKLFNGKSTKLLVIFGVLFFVVSTLFGAFVMSEPYVAEKQNYENFDSGYFTNLQVVYDSDEKNVTVTVSYSGEGTSVYVEFRPIEKIAYAWYNVSSVSEDYTHLLTETAPGIKVFTSTFSIDPNKAFAFDLISKNGDDLIDKSIDRFFLPEGMDKNMLIVGGNAYFSCMPAILFVLITFITLWLRKRLEKERKKMEADGRLYPEGYGRCKECGSIVLPGEVSCRKCGAYIDVPDNMRVKKADSFYCTDCGAEVPGDANVCPKCGAKFDDDTETVVVDAKIQDENESFQCSDCGAIVPGNAAVCPKCGAKFDEDDEPSKK